jgi:tetratricopeptide (TPR) repeat protein
VLAARGEIAEAAHHEKAAVLANPNLAPAHELWGRLLSVQEDFPSAVRELQPNSWLAQYELGLAYGRLGNRAAAIKQFKIASQGKDKQAAAAALEVMRQIGQ